MDIRTVAPLTLSALMAAASLGCLVRDSRHDLIVDPDGSVTWTVLETEARSDASDAASALAEEREWIEALRRGDGPSATFLRALGASDVDVLVLRDARPAAAWTSARLGTLDEVAERFCTTLDVRSEATLVARGSERRLTLVTWENERPDEPLVVEDPTAGLDMDSLRVVLSRGRFTGAVGFRLASDRVAVLVEDEDTPDEAEVEEADDGSKTYALSWVVD